MNSIMLLKGEVKLGNSKRERMNSLETPRAPIRNGCRRKLGAGLYDGW